METTETLPTWQLGSIYPALDSDAYLHARRDLETRLAELEDLLGAGLPDPTADADTVAAAFEAGLARFDTLRDLLATLDAFITGFVATNAFDDAAAAEQSVLRPLSSRLALALRRFQAWLARTDLDALRSSSAVARDHPYFLQRSTVIAERMLPPDAEELVAALEPSGGGAWARLHGALISRHTVPLRLPGRPETEAGVAQLYNLQRDPDRQVRERAWRAEIELLARNEVSYTAAMNSIKAEVDELARRRGWSDPLELSLFDNGIGAASLEAMHTACREAFPHFRRYLRAKAALLGLDGLSWHDLHAPVASGPKTGYGWPEAQRFVVEQFRRYWAPLADYAERAFAAGWIDVAPRKGKRNGAFCMGVPQRAESRILLNFGGSLDDVFTLAHELGHGYHNERRYRAGSTSFQSATPMTLAETASIFCETVVVNAMLERADDAARLAILEQDLLGTAQLVVDIHSRFLFERTVFDKRRGRELSPGELRGIMLDAQAATYGDALRSDGRHPLMWAHKGHYYSSGRSFYNYPYTFGYLFALGLYAEYRRRPDGFQERYDELLADTGTADAATLAGRFGIDIDDPGFWRAGLAVSAERVDEYEALVAADLEGRGA